MEFVVQLSHNFLQIDFIFLLVCLRLHRSWKTSFNDQLLINFRHFTTAKDQCKTLEKALSVASEGFIRCALNSSEPVTYCQDCGNDFAAVVTHYNDLFTDEHCQAKYFNQDRLNIVEMVYTSIQSIWNAGSCTSKFSSCLHPEKWWERNCCYHVLCYHVSGTLFFSCKIDCFQTSVSLKTATTGLTDKKIKFCLTLPKHSLPNGMFSILVVQRIPRKQCAPIVLTITIK